ncbi:DNA mismatch repair endonuclease MutL [Vibrio cholerae]
MTIKILPARLANQIAAGEVVERPASVVKELVENSLDSGASRIDIDIEKGGAKLIRVRDNGSGIEKDELGLALSRHATSKIHTLDDLEAIMSLGFRGEALASISSVARLTLTSRTATQDAAWSAYSEGRDMAVKIQPAAHPIGTTVEVLDLFFNTPARRKFLRTEKTEFTHIDELLKRIALSRFDVSINLRHNGKLVKQYRAAKTESQAEKRIAAVCGSGFVRHMLKIELEHQGLKLHGWITTPQGARAQSDLQYCYVNGRMMRDKLINHAIRQSYETSLKPEQFAAYVLFIELDPHHVDVNVHPAKHEVRFHQARLVHDFIYQALTDALAQGAHIDKPEQSQSAFHDDQTPSFDAAEHVPAYPGRADYVTAEPTARNESRVNERGVSHSWVQSRSEPARSVQARGAKMESTPSQAELRVYQTLLSATEDESATEEKATKETQNSHARSTLFNEESLSDEGLTHEESAPVVQATSIVALGKAISIVAGQYVLMADKSHSQLVSLVRAEWWRIHGQLNTKLGPLTSQPLLVPLSLRLESPLLESAERYHELLLRLGIQLKPRGQQGLLVMGVPQPLRQQNLQQLLPDLLSYAATYSAQALDEPALVRWLTNKITQTKSDYTLSEAIHIIAELEQLWHGQLPLDDRQFVRPVDYSATIAAMTL